MSIKVNTLKLVEYWRMFSLKIKTVRYLVTTLTYFNQTKCPPLTKLSHKEFSLIKIRSLRCLDSTIFSIAPSEIINYILPLFLNL